MVRRYVKKLRGKHISITESLTKKRMVKLTETREQHGFPNVRTSNRKILVRE